MMKITHYTVTNQFQTDAEYVLIDRGNDEFSTMPKEAYEKMLAEQSTPIVTDEAKTK
jgi:hypothetical protein